MPARPSALLAPTLFALGLSCGSAPPEGTVARAPEPLVLEGSVTYERRVPTEQGLTSGTERRPARQGRGEIKAS